MSELIGKNNELNFYGIGSADAINRGLKLATCRESNGKYDFEVGQVVIANCRDDGGKKVEVVVCEVLKEVQLGSIPIEVLSLDGFFNYDMAVQSLRRHYPDLDMTTAVDYIVFLAKEKFDSLGEERQSILLSSSTEEAMLTPELTDIFRASIAFWMGVRNGNLLSYHNYLESHGLTDGYEIQQFTEAISMMIGNSRGRREKIMRELDNLFRLAQKADPSDPLYSWSILLHEPTI